VVYGLIMSSPEFTNLLALYQQTLTAGVLEYFQKQAKLKIRRGVYCAQVVLWLMMLQRLHRVGTLSAAVQLLLQGAAGPLLQDCRRVRQRRISARTGGFSQARRRLPAVLCRQVSREITEQLRQMVGPSAGNAARAYLLDGSSIELEHSRELVDRYPPAQNQYGRSHWPVLRIVVLHELDSGLAEEPQWGPMYGPQAESEQALAEKGMDRLPAYAVIRGRPQFRSSVGSVCRTPAEFGSGITVNRGACTKVMGWSDRAGGRAGSDLDGEPLGRGKTPSVKSRSSGSGPVDRGSGRARQVETMAVPVQHAGLAGRENSRALWKKMEHRNRSAFPQADRAASSHGGKERSHVGEGTADGRVRLQSGACRHELGRPDP